MTMLERLKERYQHDRHARDEIKQHAFRLEGSHALDPVIEVAKDARYVLIGEASHGTDEFYHTRAQITQRLIQEHGFNVVAVEGDWPDVYRINCFVRGRGSDSSAEAALGSFERFPLWMWRNTVVRDFVSWLHAYNEGKPYEQQAGFYGLDLYSMHSSINAVLSYLEQVDPEAAKRAKQRYSCFEYANQDPQLYGYRAHSGRESCEDAVVEQLLALQQEAATYASRDGHIAVDNYFYAEQNARLVRNAEEYYRTMFAGRVSSWNLRDKHMVETLKALVQHLDQQNSRPTKAIIWAHNSHLGDARATEMSDRGELNVGQLVRELAGNDAVSIGFSTYTGTVSAASDWDAPVERKWVRPALPESYEAQFHELDMGAFGLIMRNNAALSKALQPARLERAIGVIYRPDTERWSHYFYTDLPAQFDVLLHIDTTSALEPLDRSSGWEEGELPDTFPFGQ